MGNFYSFIKRTPKKIFLIFVAILLIFALGISCTTTSDEAIEKADDEAIIEDLEEESEPKIEAWLDTKTPTPAVYDAEKYIIEYEVVEFAEVGATEDGHLLMIIGFAEDTAEEVMQDTVESFLRSLAFYSVKHSDEFTELPNDNYYGDLYDVQPTYIVFGFASSDIIHYDAKSIRYGADMINW